MKARKTQQKSKATRAKPASNVGRGEASDPFSLVSDVKIRMPIRLRTAAHMISKGDNRVRAFLEDIAANGKPAHRARAHAALMRHGGAANSSDPVEKLTEEERLNISKKAIRDWLTELRDGDVKKRDHARMWADLIATPQIIRDYLASTEAQDNDAR